MHSIKSTLAAKIGAIIVSLLQCLLGIALIVYPALSAKILCILTGGLMICYGIFKIIGYLSGDLYRLAFQFDLALGLFGALLGLILLIFPAKMIALVNFIIGILILSDGLFKIQITFDAKAFGIRQWRLILSLAVITVFLGILVIIDPFSSSTVLMMLLGIALIAEGILNFSVMLCTVKVYQAQSPPVIEATAYQEEEKR